MCDVATGPGPSGGREMSAAVRGRAGSVSVDGLLSEEGAASEIVSAGMGPGVGFEDVVGFDAGGMERT